MKEREDEEESERKGSLNSLEREKPLLKSWRISTKRRKGLQEEQEPPTFMRREEAEPFLVCTLGRKRLLRGGK
jgi:hypothetical protein